MDYRLKDLIDIPAFQKLQDSLDALITFPSAIIDNDGEILTATAWQDICVKFHRRHPETRQQCLKSDRYILEHLEEGDPTVSYRCPHGLIDNATPIVIGGRHLGNVFTGQVFLEPPDLEHFREQARRYGFEEEAYVQAAARVPVWSREQLGIYLGIMQQFTEILGNVGSQRLKQLESEAAYRLLAENSTDLVCRLNAESKTVLYASPASRELVGYEPEELLNMQGLPAVHPDDVAHVREALARARASDEVSVFSCRLLRRDGQYVWTETAARRVRDPQTGQITEMQTSTRDISARRATEEDLRESEARYRSTLSSMDEIVLLIDREGRFLPYQQDATRYSLMMPPAAFEGRPYREVLPPELVEGLRRAIAETERTGTASRFEYQLPIGGALRQYSASVTQRLDPSGVPGGATVVIGDITDRKRAEETVREREAQLEMAIEATGIGLFMWDVDTGRIGYSPGWQKQAGHSVESISEGMVEWQSRIHPDDLRETLEAVEQFAANETADFEVEFRFRNPDGEYRWVLMRASVLPATETRGRRLVGCHVDITDRKQAEEELRSSERRHREVLEAALDGFTLLGPEGRLLQVNRAYCEMSGYSEQELLSFSAPDLDAGGDRERVTAHLRELKARGQGIFEARHRRKDGSVYDVEISIRYDPAGGGRFVSFVRDISARKRAEQIVRALIGGAAAQTGEAFFDQMAAHLASALGADGVCIVERPHADCDEVSLISYCLDGSIARPPRFALQGTPSAEVLRGCTRSYPHGVCELFPHDQAIRELGIEGYVGVPLWGDETEPIGLMVATYRRPLDDPALVESVLELFAGRVSAEILRRRAEDAQRELEAQLQRAQRLESLGVLAGGIAHDFNNILSAMLGWVGLAGEEVGPEGRAADLLRRALQAGQRARDLVKQILAVASRAPAERKPLRVQEVVQGALRLARATLPATVEIREQMPATDLTILADATQIHQVLLNLCTNAEFAMRPAGGRLGVTVEALALRAPLPPALAALLPGNYVRLIVSDTGCGMDADTRERVFDPFFTTKPAGEGSGLGLATSYGIITGHDGLITVDSEPGVGSTFTIYLPATDAEPTVDREVATPPASGHGRVLFVDDERDIAEIAETLLSSLGYEPSIFTDPLAAIEAFRANPDAFDVAVTDQTMPQLTGLDLIAQIRKLNLHLPVVLTTGHSSAITPERTAALGISEVLRKPYGLWDLAEAVQRALAPPEH